MMMMDRIPLSDETPSLDDDVIDNELDSGFQVLDFDTDPTTTYLPEEEEYDVEDEDVDDLLNDAPGG